MKPIVQLCAVILIAGFLCACGGYKSGSGGSSGGMKYPMAGRLIMSRASR